MGGIIKPTLAAIIAAGMGFLGCAGSSVTQDDIQNALQAQGPKVEQYEPSAVDQPDSQAVIDARIKAHKADILKKVDFMSPVFTQEYKDGELKFEFGEKGVCGSKKYDISLSACYNGIDRVTTECSEHYSECLNDAVYHELGHRVWDSFDINQKVKLSMLLVKRLRLDDAKDFRIRLDAIESETDKIIRVTEGEAILEICKNIQKSYGYAGLFVKIMEETGRPEKAEALREKLKQYSAMMPSCNEENYEASKRILDVMNSKTDCLARQIMDIYRNNLNLSDMVDCGADYEMPLVIPDVSGLHSAAKSFEKTFDEIREIVSGEVYEKLLGDSRTRDDIYAVGMTYEKAKDLTFALSMLSSVSSEIALRYGLMSFESITGTHDNDEEEQFAAAVDSLYHFYKGPVRMGPMQMKLTEPLLDALAEIKYKGVNIFAPQVEVYRREVLQ